MHVYIQNDTHYLVLIKFLFIFPLQEHGIDGSQLAQMVEEDLENLGIPKVLNVDLVLTIKVNVKRERGFDRPTIIFKFKMRSKICAYIQL